MANLVSDVLEEIFSHLHDNWSGDLFDPQYRYHPLLFVCANWHSVAERKLYERIGLDVFDRLRPHSYERRKEICVMLHRTLQDNQRLASLVNELQLALIFESAEDSLIIASILRLCKNVKHVIIWDADNKFMEGINTALIQKDLVSLSFQRYRHPIPPVRTPFRSPSDVLNLIANYPRLRSIVANGVGVETNVGGAMMPTPVPPLVRGCCPALTSIDMTATSLDASQLLMLSEMAPRAESVSLMLESQTPADALRTCLETWSRTLIHFNMDYFAPGLTGSLEALPKLQNLKTLAAPSTAFPPIAVAQLSRLENLKYLPSVEHVEQLAVILENKDALPELKVLSLDQSTLRISVLPWPMPFEQDRKRNALQNMKTACLNRDIRFLNYFKALSA